MTGTACGDKNNGQNVVCFGKKKKTFFPLFFFWRGGAGSRSRRFSRPLSLSLALSLLFFTTGPFAEYGYDDFGGRIMPGCIKDRFRYATCSCKRIDENTGAPPALVDSTVEWISGRAPLPIMQPRGL